VFARACKELAAIDFTPLKIDLGGIERRRDWLAADLRVLATTLRAPLSLDFFGPRSRLSLRPGRVCAGGQVISKRVKHPLGLGLGSGGANFMASAGTRQASDLLTALNTPPPNSAMSADAEAGAISTFLAFRQAISQKCAANNPRQQSEFLS
jgi:hypothetical protein